MVNRANFGSVRRATVNGRGLSVGRDQRGWTCAHSLLVQRLADKSALRARIAAKELISAHCPILRSLCWC